MNPDSNKTRQYLLRRKKLWKLSLDYEFDRIRNYLELIVKADNDYRDEQNNLFEERLSQSEDDEEWNVIHEMYYEDFYEANKELPRILYSTFVAVLYSFIERKLIYFCKLQDIPLMASDKGITKVKQGIKQKYKSFDFYNTPQWSELKIISKLRNLILHGELNSNERKKQLDKNFYNYLKKHDLIELDTAYVDIHPTYDYCVYLIDFTEKFFKAFIEEYSKSFLAGNQS